jgi:hypothetical protein
MSTEYWPAARAYSTLLGIARYITAALLIAFCSPVNSASTLTEDDLKYPGFQTFPTPRTFDGPGTVFRLTADQHRYSVTLLKVRIDKVGTEEFPNYSSDVKWSVGALVNLLKVRLLSTPEVGAELQRQVQINISLGTGYRERTYDDDVDQALRSAHIAYRRDSRYFVVREAIAVDSLSISANPRTSAGADAHAALNRIATAEGTLHWQDETHKSLVRTFTPPHYAFYLVDEVLPPGPGVAGESVPRRYKLTDEILRWTDEAVDPPQGPSTQ